MIELNIQFFGGRGGGGSGGSRDGRSGGGGGAQSAEEKAKQELLSIRTSYTTRELAKMDKPQLARIAEAVYVKTNMARGKSFSDARKTFNDLLPSNGVTYLRKYINRYGK